MHVLKTFLQKVAFIMKTMPVSLHRLTRTSWSSFPAAFAVPFPEQGVTVTILDTLCRGALLYPTRDLNHVAGREYVPVHTSFGVRPSIRSKPITAFSATLQTHPFVQPYTSSRLPPIIRLYSWCTLDNPS